MLLFATIKGSCFEHFYFQEQWPRWLVGCSFVAFYVLLYSRFCLFFDLRKFYYVHVWCSDLLNFDCILFIILLAEYCKACIFRVHVLFAFCRVELFATWIFCEWANITHSVKKWTFYRRQKYCIFRCNTNTIVCEPCFFGFKVKRRGDVGEGGDLNIVHSITVISDPWFYEMRREWGTIS